MAAGRKIEGPIPRLPPRSSQQATAIGGRETVASAGQAASRNMPQEEAGQTLDSSVSAASTSAPSSSAASTDGDPAHDGHGIDHASRNVRIFISSTFRDFAIERDLLVRKVFPELRRRCRERQVELVDVDLRWGITEAEAEQGKVLPICLAEIDRARPFFMGLLGERYGWVPAAGQFDRSLLIEQPWLEEHAGGKSVTELEILHGVLNNPQMAGRAFFYFRAPAWSAAQGPDYASASEAEREKLAALKDRIRASGFPLVEDYSDPEALAERVREDLWSLIDAAYPQADVPDPLTLERRRHEAYGGSRRQLYLGGERYFEALDTELAAESPRPVLVRGKSGGGKSALVANWLARWSQAHPDTAVIVHHLGCGADAADPVRLAVRIMQEIALLVGEEFKPKSNPDEQLDDLATWLATASAWAGRTGRTVLVVLDGLDKLADRRHLRWFPTVLPPGVRLVASCLDGEVLEAAAPRLPWRELIVEPFTAAEQAHFIGEYLGRFRKQLTAEQACLLQAHPLVGNPLFLLTVLEELRVFGVHEELDQRLATLLSPPPSKQLHEEPTVDDAFEHVLARLEDDLGREAVQRNLEAIWASRAGLYTDEILAIAEVPPATWAGVANALDESLYESSGRINFGHDYLRKAVEDRYAISGDRRLALHRRLAEYFSSREVDARVAEELPWQWVRAGLKDRLEQCLTDWTLFVLLKERDEYELLAYWLQLGKDVSSAYEAAWQRWAIQGDAADWVASRLVEFLNTAGCYTSFSLDMWGDVVIKQQKKLGRDHPAAIEALVGLARCCWGVGDMTNAVRMSEVVLSLTRTKYGAEHSTTLMAMANLAVSYLRRGHPEEAWLTAREVRRVCNERGGIDPETARVLNVLAESNLDNCRGWERLLMPEAPAGSESEVSPVKVREQVLRVMTTQMGVTHPETLIAMSLFADGCQKAGRQEEAIAVQKEALRVMQQQLGPNHPYTLRIMERLADTLSAVGQLQDTLGLREELLPRLRQRLGPHHWDTMMALQELARCLQKTGMTSLSNALAEEFGQHTGNLELDFLTSISDAAARALSGHEGMLLLNGLTGVSDVAAEAFGKHIGSLALNGITALTDAAVESLARHRGRLELNGLTSLSDVAAQALATHKGDLALNGLVSLSEAAARSLADHEGGLDLSGVRSLSDIVAQALAQHKGWRLGLNGLSSLADTAARSFVEHDHHLELDGIKSLSDIAAQALAQHKSLLTLEGLTALSDTPGHLALANNLARHGGLHLNSVTSLGPAAARVLGQHKGYLRLNGIVDLSDASARELAAHEGTLELKGLTILSDSPGHVLLATKLAMNKNTLHLNCLTVLGVTAARALATHSGELQLKGLTGLSDETAEALAEHGAVRLNDWAQAAVKQVAYKQAAYRALEGVEHLLAVPEKSILPDPPGMVTNSIGMKLVPIRAGEFLMGSPADCPFGDAENEEFQHWVRITKPFLLGMHQVTQSQYEQVTGENPSLFKGADLPVDHISWKEARRLCELLSALPEERRAGRHYRLPTEAEWEYACRAGTTTTFNTGDTLELRQARFAIMERNSSKPTAPVGSYPPNAWGLFDMHGNVWEWTSDWFSADYYRESPVDDPQGPPTGTHHTLRGGSASVQAHECRCAIRGEASAVDGPHADTATPFAFYGDFGVRVVCIRSTTLPSEPVGAVESEHGCDEDKAGGDGVTAADRPAEPTPPDGETHATGDHEDGSRLTRMLAAIDEGDATIAGAVVEYLQDAVATPHNAWSVLAYYLDWDCTQPPDPLTDRVGTQSVPLGMPEWGQFQFAHDPSLADLVGEDPPEVWQRFKSYAERRGVATVPYGDFEMGNWLAERLADTLTRIYGGSDTLRPVRIFFAAEADGSGLRIFTPLAVGEAIAAPVRASQRWVLEALFRLAEDGSRESVTKHPLRIGGLTGRASTFGLDTPVDLRPQPVAWSGETWWIVLGNTLGRLIRPLPQLNVGYRVSRDLAGTAFENCIDGAVDSLVKLVDWMATAAVENEQIGKRLLPWQPAILMAATASDELAAACHPPEWALEFARAERGDPSAAASVSEYLKSRDRDCDHEDDDDPPPSPLASPSDPPGTVTNSIGLKFVPIPAGEFLMGSPADDPLGDSDEEFQHRVRITRPFLFGMHQVTQTQYEQVAGENPSFFRGLDLPVEHLSWKQAQRFCEMLSALPEECAAGRRYRLPTEAEWEYACRAGTTTSFNTGDTLELHQARFATWSRSSPKPTAPVGSYPPNALGLFDMHGNVWEWTSDWFSADYYRESPVDDPQGPATGTHHTLRGGSASVEAHECRSAIRGEAIAVDGPETDTGNRYALYGDFGLRVVCIDSSGDTKAVQPAHQHGRQDPAGPESNRVGSDGKKRDAGLLDSALEDWRMVCRAQRPGRLESFQRLAERLAACGDHAAAERLYRRAIEGCEGLLGAEHPASRHYGRRRADCLASLGRAG